MPQQGPSSIPMSPLSALSTPGAALTKQTSWIYKRHPTSRRIMYYNRADKSAGWQKVRPVNYDGEEPDYTPEERRDFEQLLMKRAMEEQQRAVEAREHALAKSLIEHNVQHQERMQQLDTQFNALKQQVQEYRSTLQVLQNKLALDTAERKGLEEQKRVLCEQKEQAVIKDGVRMDMDIDKRIRDAKEKKKGLQRILQASNAKNNIEQENVAIFGDPIRSRLSGGSNKDEENSPKQQIASSNDSSGAESRLILAAQHNQSIAAELRSALSNQLSIQRRSAQNRAVLTKTLEDRDGAAFHLSTLTQRLATTAQKVKQLRSELFVDGGPLDKHTQEATAKKSSDQLIRRISQTENTSDESALFPAPPPYLALIYSHLLCGNSKNMDLVVGRKSLMRLRQEADEYYEVVYTLASRLYPIGRVTDNEKTGEHDLSPHSLLKCIFEVDEMIQKKLLSYPHRGRVSTQAGAPTRILHRSRSHNHDRVGNRDATASDSKRRGISMGHGLDCYSFHQNGDEPENQCESADASCVSLLSSVFGSDTGDSDREYRGSVIQRPSQARHLILAQRKRIYDVLRGNAMKRIKDRREMERLDIERRISLGRLAGIEADISIRELEIRRFITIYDMIKRNEYPTSLVTLYKILKSLRKELNQLIQDSDLTPLHLRLDLSDVLAGAQQASTADLEDAEMNKTHAIIFLSEITERVLDLRKLLKIEAAQVTQPENNAEDTELLSLLLPQGIRIPIRDCFLRAINIPSVYPLGMEGGKKWFDTFNMHKITDAARSVAENHYDCIGQKQWSHYVEQQHSKIAHQREIVGGALGDGKSLPLSPLQSQHISTAVDHINVRFETLTHLDRLLWKASTAFPKISKKQIYLIGASVTSGNGEREGSRANSIGFSFEEHEKRSISLHSSKHTGKQKSSQDDSPSRKVTPMIAFDSLEHQQEQLHFLLENFMLHVKSRMQQPRREVKEIESHQKFPKSNLHNGQIAKYQPYRWSPGVHRKNSAKRCAPLNKTPRRSAAMSGEHLRATDESSSGDFIKLAAEITSEIDFYERK